jgi:hypothetical protein
MTSESGLIEEINFDTWQKRQILRGYTSLKNHVAYKKFKWKL